MGKGQINIQRPTRNVQRSKGGALGEHALPTARTGKAFWKQKMAANVARDKFVTRTLRKLGWRVIRIWEHELAKAPLRCVSRIRYGLKAAAYFK